MGMNFPPFTRSARLLQIKLPGDRSTTRSNAGFSVLTSAVQWKYLCLFTKTQLYNEEKLNGGIKSETNTERPRRHALFPRFHFVFQLASRLWKFERDIVSVAFDRLKRRSRPSSVVHARGKMLSVRKPRILCHLTQC